MEQIQQKYTQEHIWFDAYVVMYNGPIMENIISDFMFEINNKK